MYHVQSLIHSNGNGSHVGLLFLRTKVTERAGITNVWISFHPWHAAAASPAAPEAEMESYEVLPSLNFFFKIPPHSGWNEKSGKSFFFNSFQTCFERNLLSSKNIFVEKFFREKRFWNIFGKIPDWKSSLYSLPKSGLGQEALSLNSSLLWAFQNFLMSILSLSNLLSFTQA